MTTESAVAFAKAEIRRGFLKAYAVNDDGSVSVETSSGWHAFYEPANDTAWDYETEGEYPG